MSNYLKINKNINSLKKIHNPPIDKELQAANDSWKGRNQSFWGMIVIIGDLIPSGQPKNI